MHLGLLMLLGTFSPFGPPALPPTSLAVRAGERATLQVRFETSDVLLSRDAPNRLTLSTPWGRGEAQPSGTPQRHPEYKGYFAQVRPVTLTVKVPATAKAGLYTGRFEAELFVCDKLDKLCVPRTVQGTVRLNVGQTGGAGVLVLKDAQLRPKRLAPSPRGSPER